MQKEKAFNKIFNKNILIYITISLYTLNTNICPYN